MAAPRKSAKPSSSMTPDWTKAIQAQAKASPPAMSVAVRRGPRLSIQRPITGAGRIPASVPAAYAMEAQLREMPRSAVIGSKKTETPAVWPGKVMKEPNVPAARITQP
jgi:hypothetical protein